MLRSYEYTDQLYTDIRFQNDLYREKEVKLARDFVYSGPVRRDMSSPCPVCGRWENEYFYTKWEVDYLRCRCCKSVFAVCGEDTVRRYKKNQELMNLRTSGEYQEETSRIRQDSWNEFLEWMKFRTFRFMHKNRNLSIIDFGNRFKGYSDLIKASPLCGKYDLRDSILSNDSKQIDQADLVFYMDQLQQVTRPEAMLLGLKAQLKDDGMLVLGTRAGSGFDVVTLKDKNETIYPYEHVLLPSVKGLIGLLERTGYKILEVTTPGVMDVTYVMECIEKLDRSEMFVRDLLESAQQPILQEFQRFLQKYCLSSFVRILSKKRNPS